MNIFHPKLHVKNIQNIDLKTLKKNGISNLIVDLDETLRKRNSLEIPQTSVDWIASAKNQGFNICITSNNPFPWRNRNVENILGVPCSTFALKPLPFAFRHALRILRSGPLNAALIGDQLFTDIVGANIVGIYTILVDPITGAEKGIFRRIMRWLEQKIFPRVNLELK